MSEIYIINEETLTNIADAIREKRKEDINYTPIEMPNAISTIKMKETLSWHQCPEVVRNYLAEAQSLYPTQTGVTVIHKYAERLNHEIDSNTKPIGFTFDGTTFYDNIP